MSDPGMLDERLATALSRIEAALGQLPDPGAAIEAREALEAQLQTERETNEQLINRVKALKDRQENQVAQLERDLVETRDAHAQARRITEDLKVVVEDLREQVARLTEANRAMVANPQLINTAMMVELEAMRASRRADFAEVEDILAQLATVNGGDAHA